MPSICFGVRLQPAGEELVRRDAPLVVRPAGERVLAELLRLSAEGYARLDQLGLLRPLGGSLDRVGELRNGPSPNLLLVAALVAPLVDEHRDRERQAHDGDHVAQELPGLERHGERMAQRNFGITCAPISSIVCMTFA